MYIICDHLQYENMINTYNILYRQTIRMNILSNIYIKRTIVLDLDCKCGATNVIANRPLTLKTDSQPWSDAGDNLIASRAPILTGLCLADTTQPDTWRAIFGSTNNGHTRHDDHTGPKGTFHSREYRHTRRIRLDVLRPPGLFRGTRRTPLLFCTAHKNVRLF